MFGINTYSRACILRQNYVTSGMAVKTLSVSGKVDRGCKVNVHPCPSTQGTAGVHTSTVRAKNLMKKFLNKSKKKLWYESPPQSSSSQPDFMKPPQRRGGQEDTSRSRVLNSVLFKAVSDLLTSPELDPQVLSYSVEVSRVSMSPDFSCCRLYWKTSGLSAQDDVIQSALDRTSPKPKPSAQDDVIQSALDRTSPRIRYLIMSQQTMGGVPPLVFIKDKQYAAMVEVEKLLQTADFGPEDLDAQDGGGEQRSSIVPPAPSARPVLFGVDHEALGRQIQDYRQRVREAGPGVGPGAGPEGEGLCPALTQAQLTALEDYRKQKIVEKRKKKKSKRPVDDDVTPKEFLRQQRWDQEAEPDEGGGAFGQEDTQLGELMAEENRKS